VALCIEGVCGSNFDIQKVESQNVILPLRLCEVLYQMASQQHPFHLKPFQFFFSWQKPKIVFYGDVQSSLLPPLYQAYIFQIIQIDRKKQSLKEGGEYEDSALLLKTHPGCYPEKNASFSKFITEVSSRKHHIWPQKLHPRDLPGPLYALSFFVFKSLNLEPEMVAPTINTDIKWKLQVLEKKSNLR
ncbi:unnamed protein product, partial [Cylicostephanus goldi]